MKAICITNVRWNLIKWKEYEVEWVREQEFSFWKRKQTIETYNFVKIIWNWYLKENFEIIE